VVDDTMKKAGSTLAELSVVLIIIALIIGMTIKRRHRHQRDAIFRDYL
jgi:competence protein ComGC